MVNYGTMTYPEKESAGCHFGTIGERNWRPKTKSPPGDLIAIHKYPVA